MIMSSPLCVHKVILTCVVLIFHDRIVYKLMYICV